MCILKVGKDLGGARLIKVCTSCRTIVQTMLNGSNDCVAVKCLRCIYHDADSIMSSMQSTTKNRGVEHEKNISLRKKEDKRG